MGAEPADGGFAVVELCGPVGLVGEPVADGGADVVAVSDEGGEDAGVVFGSAFPAAAVDIDEERAGFVCGFFGEIKVEGLPAVIGRGVGDVFADLEVFCRIGECGECEGEEGKCGAHGCALSTCGGEWHDYSVIFRLAWCYGCLL